MTSLPTITYIEGFSTYYPDLHQKETEIAKVDMNLDSLLELRTAKEITAEEYLTKKNQYIDNKQSYEGKITLSLLTLAWKYSSV